MNNNRLRTVGLLEEYERTTIGDSLDSILCL